MMRACGAGDRSGQFGSAACSAGWSPNAWLNPGFSLGLQSAACSAGCRPEENAMDLRTEYLGLTLKNPIVPSSSPLSYTIDSIRRLEDAGAAAVVMYSLFEEQITAESYYLDYYLSHGTDSYAESLSYFPEMERFNVGPDEYLEV